MQKIIWCIICLLFSHQVYGEKVKAISRFGEPKYGTNEIKFTFLNPEAPKGGQINLSAVGTFDTLNWLSIKGTPVYGSIITFDSLMMRSAGESFAVYSALAEYVDLAKDNSSIIFYLQKSAQFHDGTPFTAEDVKFTIDLLFDKGPPRYKKIFSKVEKIEIIDPHTIKFIFKKGEDGKFDPELPLIIALIKPLSKKQLEKIDFTNTGLMPLQGTGPYKISQFEQGRFIVYERNQDYWGKDVPFLKGMYNFDKIRIDYFKNAQAQFQAFVSGETDIYFETNPIQWETAYGFKAVKEGRVKKINFEHKRPVVVRTIIFNMRRHIFDDIRVRKAISLAFDFDTLNRLICANSMLCPHSLFANTFLAHNGGAKDKELEILNQFKAQIAPELFEEIINDQFHPAKTKGDGDQRENLKKADELLKSAGFDIKEGRRINKDGKIVSIELMIKDPRLEKIAISFRESLSKLGIVLNVKMIDTVQYENRVVESDFDMVIHSWANTLAPGFEQSYYFGAKYADVKGSSNYIGVKDTIAESLANLIPLANNLEDLTCRAHALDRYVMHNYWQIPLAYNNVDRWAYWVDRIKYPEVLPEVGTNVMDWGWRVSTSSQVTKENDSNSIFVKIKNKLQSLFS